MKYMVTPEFSAKALKLETKFVREMNKIIKAIEIYSKENLLASKDLNISSLGDEVYVLAEGELKIYFSFYSDENDELLLMLDVVAESKTASSRTFFAVKDPKINSSFNPSFNPTINPMRNPTKIVHRDTSHMHHAPPLTHTQHTPNTPHLRPTCNPLLSTHKSTTAVTPPPHP